MSRRVFTILFNLSFCSVTIFMVCKVLALAFSGDATLLILDEPTNHLDDAGRKTLAEWIAQRGRGVVVISHDSVFEAVDAVCWKLQNGGLAYV